MPAAAQPRRGAPPPPDQWDPHDCRQLWADALLLYLRDAQAGARGSQTPHAAEALADLLGARVMLARLCEPLALDVEAVALGMLARLA